MKLIDVWDHFCDLHATQRKTCSILREDRRLRQPAASTSHTLSIPHGPVSDLQVSRILLFAPGEPSSHPPQPTRHTRVISPMISNSLRAYCGIQASIIGLRSVTPLSVVFLATSAWFGRFPISKWLGVYASIEVLFYLLVYLPRKSRLQKVSWEV